MSVIVIHSFGGMMPGADDRLIGPNVATLAKNAWLYSGAVRGMFVPTVLRTCSLAGTGKVYRIPASYTRASYMYNSLWMEFVDPDTDVIRAPVSGDTFDRYYWASTSLAPKYNTRARIAYGQNVRTAVVTFDSTTELVSWAAHGLAAGDTVKFTTTGGLAAPLVVGTTYYVSSSGLVAGAFKLSISYANAIVGTSINLTTNGSGVNTGTTGTEPEYLLGIPTPGAAPTCVVTGGVAANVTRSYVCTWVSAYGEEGATSAALVKTGAPDGSWDLTLPGAAAGDLGVDRNLTKVRIYRTITSAAGVASFFFVAEQDINDTTYSDVSSDATVAANALLQSTLWTGPPADLQGLVMLPNGIAVGWRSNELWFSEPYRPHAWPAPYVLTLEFPIMGLGVLGQTVIACTTGNPYTVSGVTPATMSQSKLPSIEPCLTRGSIVSSPGGVYYASPNGLMMVSPGRVDNVIKDLVTKDQWQSLTLGSPLRAALLGTAYYGFGVIRTGVFDPSAFEVTAFTQQDYSGAVSGIFTDPGNNNVGFELLTSVDPTANVQNDPWSGELFILRNNQVLWLDQSNPAATLASFFWRSKIFQLPVKQNLGVAVLYFEMPAVVPGDLGVIRTYADGRLVHTKTITKSGEIYRLPAGFKADFYQFQFETSLKILSFMAAGDATELRKVPADRYTEISNVP